LLPLEQFSCFSHDSLHTASLIESIFTRTNHVSLKNRKGFKSKYLEIKQTINDLKAKAANKGNKKQNHFQKVELAEKIEKLQQKILTAEWVKILNEKQRLTIQGHDDSGLISMNESDISKGAFEIGIS